jgi:holo-[acyl-carrier protein] synthase
VPIRLGIDAIDVADVEDSVTRFGDRYLRRVFTNAEIESCDGGAQHRRLAACFAAKEAAAKVIPEADASLDWRRIEIRFDRGGEPRVILHGAVAESARRAGLHGFSVSVGGTRRHVSALAVAELHDQPIDRFEKVR